MLRIETEYWKYWMNNGSNRQHLVLSCSNFKTEQILSIRKQFENKIGNQFKRETYTGLRVFVKRLSFSGLRGQSIDCLFIYRVCERFPVHNTNVDQPQTM